MSLGLMPDDCLLTIFNFIQEAEVLFSCSRVCKRWYRLVSYRLSKVENLFYGEGFPEESKPNVKTIYYKPFEETKFSAMLKKTPKVKLVSLGLPAEETDGNWAQRSMDRLSQVESLKGIVVHCPIIDMAVALPQNIELFFAYDMLIQTGYYPRIKQLLLDDINFSECIHSFPNIVRLNLTVDSESNDWIKVALKKKYLFKELKIVEIDTSYFECATEENYASQFIDICPKLESAHIRIGLDQIVSKSKFKHENLKNLVVSYVDYEKVEQHYLNLLSLLSKYPNIKHLAIKYDRHYIDSVKESHKTYVIEECYSGESEYESESEFENENEDSDTEGSSPGRQDDGIFKGSVIPFLIVSMLQKLVLLDMRNVTGVDETSAKYVRHFCECQQRSIKFYFGFSKDEEIKRDWPELFSDASQDCQEYNFMKQLFLPAYASRPFFLDPY